MIHAFIALLPIHSADIAYKVVNVEKHVTRVARYGNQVSETLTLEHDGKTIKIKLSSMTDRFQGHRSIFANGDSVSYDRELKDGMLVDRYSLHKI